MRGPKLRGAARRALHPLTPALALLGVVGAGAALAVPGTAPSGPLLAVAAGCAAGFANSGST
ncbi:hypothetical protein [Pseudonocardia charpentierae]|uniref:Uncharacterized protein n=1 Tax=Pseudonocardia charpentierae TaxID=3075545 RepID=A0ABU2NH48_9PSEU|nr:hypothetical protein [Pseudonocardia sp. DSM 45834]MDT0353270.1 hypothetical protein [Pseudonocardia sp. DSM 45834]